MLEGCEVVEYTTYYNRYKNRNHRQRKDRGVILMHFTTVKLQPAT